MKTLKAALCITAGLISACSFAGIYEETGDYLFMVILSLVLMAYGFDLMPDNKKKEA